MKSEIRKLKDDIMALVKAHVKERDKYTCQRCGRSHLEKHNCQASHVHPDGRSERLSYDPLNIKVLCFQCHSWWHENPLASSEWFSEKFPERKKYIDAHKNDIVHWKIFDYRQLREEYKRGNFSFLCGDSPSTTA